MVTGLANAYLDSVPILALTGQVGVDSIGRDSFQETDIVGITMPIIKHSYLVKKIEHLPEVLEEAWQVAKEGRPGPVLIDIPKNLFSEEFAFSEVFTITRKHKVPMKNGLAKQLGKIKEVLKSTKAAGTCRRGRSFFRCLGGTGAIYSIHENSCGNFFDG